jgi:hypothetical protein
VHVTGHGCIAAAHGIGTRVGGPPVHHEARRIYTLAVGEHREQEERNSERQRKATCAAWWKRVGANVKGAAFIGLTKV